MVNPQQKKESIAGLGAVSLPATFSAEAAFSLIELCVVLVILTLMGSVILGKMTQDIRSAKVTDLQTKMDRIERALQSFARKNGRLPVPADGSQAQATSTTFGVEVTNTAAFFTSGNNTDGTTYQGVVPVRTLASYGLTDSDILDGYNDELVYVVSKKATSINAFATFTASALAAITVNDASGTARNGANSAISLLLSLGSSGHSAYQLNGVRKTGNTTNADVLTNCHCDQVTGLPNGTYNSHFVLHTANQSSSNDPTTLFDDVGRSRGPEFFLSNSG